MNLHFYKYQALGNDMIVLDPRTFEVQLTPALIRLVCDRHFGLGADGICFGPLSNGNHPHEMRFYNPDGSRAEKSGNGLRIFARYLWDRQYVSDRNFEIFIHNQIIRAKIEDAPARTISMSMGRLSFFSGDIPVCGVPREVVEESMQFTDGSFAVTAVTIGNPHCVIFYEGNLAEAAKTFGSTIEGAPPFPNRTNVQFARVLNRNTIEIEIWERGAGYTLASGTSACATAGAAVRTGRCVSPVEVRMAGGTATVAIDKQWQVTLTGSVEAVCQGRFCSDFAERAGRFQ